MPPQHPDLPAPLVPPHVDLTGVIYMPLHIDRLLNSRDWRRCKRQPELAFYFLNLWIAAFRDRPPASLENDDETLADAAGCSEERWQEVRSTVLRKWVLCSDGRLYHPVVALVVMDVWRARCSGRERTAAATAARKAKKDRANTKKQKEKTAPQRDVKRDVVRNEHDGDKRNEPRNDQRDDPRYVHQGKVSKDLRDESKSDVVVRSESPTVEDRKINIAIENTGQQPQPDVATAVGELTQKLTGNLGQKWESRAWVSATAQGLEHPIEQLPGQSWEEFRDRVYGARTEQTRRNAMEAVERIAASNASKS